MDKIILIVYAICMGLSVAGWTFIVLTLLGY